MFMRIFLSNPQMLIRQHCDFIRIKITLNNTKVKFHKAYDHITHSYTKCLI